MIDWLAIWINTGCHSPFLKDKNCLKLAYVSASFGTFTFWPNSLFDMISKILRGDWSRTLFYSWLMTQLFYVYPLQSFFLIVFLDLSWFPYRSWPDLFYLCISCQLFALFSAISISTDSVYVHILCFPLWHFALSYHWPFPSFPACKCLCGIYICIMVKALFLDCIFFCLWFFFCWFFLSHLAKENVSFCHHLSSVVCPSSVVCRMLTFHILIFSSETPQPNELKLIAHFVPTH